MMKNFDFSVTGANSNTTLFQTDSETFRGETLCSMCVQVTSQGTSATLQYEQSNDGLVWRPCPVWLGDAATSGVTTTSAGAGIFVTQWYSRFFRLRVTGMTSGTLSGVAIGSEAELGPQATSVTIAGNPSTFSTPVPVPGNGGTYYKIRAAASTNVAMIKGSFAVITGIVLTNTTASAKYLKIYNVNTAPTVGTTTPAMEFVIPANSTLNIDSSFGIKLSTGLAFAITGGIGDTDATVTAVNDVVGMIAYA